LASRAHPAAAQHTAAAFFRGMRARCRARRAAAYIDARARAAVAGRARGSVFPCLLNKVLGFGLGLWLILGRIFFGCILFGGNADHPLFDFAEDAVLCIFFVF